MVCSNIAVNIGGPVHCFCSHITIYYPNADDFLIGTATEVIMLRSATNIFPTEIMMKGKFYFIGRILQLLEVWCDALGLERLLS